MQPVLGIKITKGLSPQIAKPLGYYASGGETGIRTLETSHHGLLDFESLVTRFRRVFSGAFECRSEREKWLIYMGWRAMKQAGRGFGENAHRSTFFGYL
ncbi:MAG: hypothetical protein JL50_18150 [Peptococcaceae bacterium BICA1-7]|nr:MAG: hypothetical protein JL50_18150 [Peptococcaceae bacterium BICA1-7]HBV96331.1 hypothetical protein [Desulfotomaculum sp.]